MFVTNWISTTKIQKISEITNFFRHYFLSRTEVEIVINTKKVTCQLVAKSPTDSLRNDSICELPKELTSVAKYLFLYPANFKTNTTVYGIFRPWVSFSFEVKKKQRIYYELDFGLAKWRLLDTNMRPICTFDMKENRAQFIRLVRLVFPNDKTLEMLNVNLTNKK